jgi:hypothetical protein
MKKALQDLSTKCVDTLMLVGNPVSPLDIDCDLLILDDKMSLPLPKGSSIRFKFGIYVWFNTMNYNSASKQIASLHGVPNILVPCLASHNLRPMYTQAGSPKTGLVNLMLFSGHPGLHVPWLSCLVEEGQVVTFPLMVNFSFLYCFCILYIPGSIFDQQRKT